MGTDEGIGRLAGTEALALVATARVGRVAYTRFAMPAVHLVNFRLDGSDVVFKTRRGAKLAAAVAEAVVAFEVDEVDPLSRTGWTVTITGRASLVTSAAEAERLAGLGIDSWAPDRDYFVKVRAARITGRWIGPRRPGGHDAEPAVRPPAAAA